MDGLQYSYALQDSYNNRSETALLLPPLTSDDTSCYRFINELNKLLKYVFLLFTNQWRVRGSGFARLANSMAVSGLGPEKPLIQAG